VDLTGRRFVVTGCSSGIGFETMNSLAANAPSVVASRGRGRPRLKHACAVGPTCTAVACDLSDLRFRADAAGAIRALNAPLDAINRQCRHRLSANPEYQVRCGECSFWSTTSATSPS